MSDHPGPRPRPRVALVPSEAIRPRMAGIGLRYLEMARRLPAHGLDVVLVQPGSPDDARVLVPSSVEIRPFARGELAATLADCDAVISQGQLANDVVLEAPELPTVLDFYDPFLVENLTYAPALGLDPWRNDHATWVLQMSRGDFFLCSCEEQRGYYLGFLTALGRVNPRRVADDPDLRGLIDVVPFGVPDELPPHEPYLPPAPQGVRRILFGGLYDWYDPWPVLEAVARRVADGWRLLLIRNPNPGTPQELFDRVEDWCRTRDLLLDDKGSSEGASGGVEVIDWVPAARRYDLLRDVDVLVATHTPSLETGLSLRTRFLDALAAGLPVVATEGGGMSRLLREHGAGHVVPPSDADAVERALSTVLDEPTSEATSETMRRGREALLTDFAWDLVLAPLVDFCRAPRRDPWKDDFAFRPDTVAPPDDLAFRARRKLRRIFGGEGRRGG